MKYQKPFDATDPDAPYIDESTGDSILGSVPPGAAIEHPQRELVSLIDVAGLTPSDDDLTQVAKAIQTGAVNYSVAAGTVNAITATLDPAPDDLTQGMCVNVMLAGATTGAMTFNLNGLGAESVVLPDGSAVQTGTGAAGMIVTFEWDGTHWQLRLPLSPQALNSQTAPAIRVDKTADQSMSVNIETLCTFNSVAFNDLGSLATWNGVDTLTINAGGAGKWTITGTCGCYQANAGGAAFNRIKVNNTNKIGESCSIISGSAGAQAGPISVPYKLAAGDTVKMFGFVTSGSSGQAMYTSQLPFFSAVYEGK